MSNTTTKKKSLKWRLTTAPTLKDVKEMLESDIITKEEAKELLFNLEDQNDKIKALEKQVEFLEGVVQRLTERQTPQIIYKYIDNFDWPYKKRTPYWMSVSPSTVYGTAGVVNTVMNAVQKYDGIEGATLTLTSGSSNIN